MVRLQYLNRKTEGIKLGQVVAKDLLKRIPPGLSSRSARRDPLVELDVSSKEINDDAATTICEALVKSISHEDGITQLEELRLRDNKLTASCLRSLAEVLKSAASDLQDLDISSNNICIETEDHAEAWEDFLWALHGCYVLRRLDLSNNRLGAKAFEVLAKVYAEEEQEYIEGVGDVETKLCGLRMAAGDTNLEDESNTNEAATTPLRPKKGSETQGNIKPSTSSNDHFHQTKGIRSIPFIVLGDCGFDDECALHLSYVLDRHPLVDEILDKVPQAKPGDHARQIEAYRAVDGCDGIIWKPNNLSDNGLKVLQLAEVARLGGGEDATSPTETSSMPRKASDASSPFTPLISRNRTRKGSTSTSNSSPFNAAQRVTRPDPLRNARSRIQGDILRDRGPSHNDLWRSALQMLSVARPTLMTRLADAGNQDFETPEQGLRPVTPPTQDTISPMIRDLEIELTPPSMTQRAWPSLASKVPEAQPKARPATVFKLDTNKRGQSVLLPETPAKANAPASEDTNKSRKPDVPPSTPIQLPALTYRSSLLKGLSEEAWGRIMANAVGVNRYLTDVQCTQIIAYASRRETLRREIETLGKPEHTQIWKVLEAIGCLAYS